MVFNWRHFQIGLLGNPFIGWAYSKNSKARSIASELSCICLGLEFILGGNNCIRKLQKKN